jgi:hypothetical protein
MIELLIQRFTERSVYLPRLEKTHECDPELISNNIGGVRDAVDALKTCLGTSAHRGMIPPTVETLTGNEWAMGEEFETGRNGNVAEWETVHVSHASGRRLTGRQLFRLFKAAGLIVVN